MIDWDNIDTVLLDMDGTLLDLAFDNWFWQRHVPEQYALSRGLDYAEAERILHERGVLNMPDFICNAGGVICAAVEYRGGTERDALEEIEEKITRNTRDVLTRCRDEKLQPRGAAVELARERVKVAMELRADT